MSMNTDFNCGFKSKFYVFLNGEGLFCVFKQFKGGAKSYWNHRGNKWQSYADNAWHNNLPTLIKKLQRKHAPGKQTISLGMTQHFYTSHLFE